MIYFVGAGSGAPDLITVRGARLLSEADVIVYAGSLVNPALLDYKKDGCEVYNSAKMTLAIFPTHFSKYGAAYQTMLREGRSPQFGSETIYINEKGEIYCA